MIAQAPPIKQHYLKYIVRHSLRKQGRRNYAYAIFQLIFNTKSCFVLLSKENECELEHLKVTRDHLCFVPQTPWFTLPKMVTCGL